MANTFKFYDMYTKNIKKKIYKCCKETIIRTIINYIVILYT